MSSSWTSELWKGRLYELDVQRRASSAAVFADPGEGVHRTARAAVVEGLGGTAELVAALLGAEVLSTEAPGAPPAEGAEYLPRRSMA